MQARSSSNVKIIDVSHHQGSINWPLVKADGVAGAFIKATEGKTLVDLKFSSYSTGAVQAGLKVGYYHYAHPENNCPEDEAANFYRSVKGQATDFPHVLDVEGAAETLGRDALTDWCVKWLQEVERLTGHPAMIYCNTSFAKNLLGPALAKWPLWIAHPGVNTPDGNAIWAQWSVFQYSWTSKVAGITGDVDFNVMERSFFDRYVNADGTEVEEDMSKIEELEKRIAELEKKQSLPEIPEWAVEACVAAKRAGTVDTTAGGSYDFYRTLTVLHRAGVIK